MRAALRTAADVLGLALDVALWVGRQAREALRGD